MLKEVMLGAGGVMLAAAIFASSVVPSVDPAAAGIAPAPVAVQAVPAAPPQPAPQVVPSPPPPVLQDDSGDVQFGAPMIETTPVESGDSAPIAPDPEGEESPAGRQFNSKPGRPYPIPR